MRIRVGNVEHACNFRVNTQEQCHLIIITYRERDMKKEKELTRTSFSHITHTSDLSLRGEKEEREYTQIHGG